MFAQNFQACFGQKRQFVRNFFAVISSQFFSGSIDCVLTIFVDDLKQIIATIWGWIWTDGIHFLALFHSHYHRWSVFVSAENQQNQGWKLLEVQKYRYQRTPLTVYRTCFWTQVFEHKNTLLSAVFLVQGFWAHTFLNPRSIERMLYWAEFF